MQFSELLASLDLTTLPTTDAAITAPITERVQDVLPGGVFVARVGATLDGHTLIPQAVARGAAAVIGERPASAVACPVPYAAVPDARAILAPLAAAYYGYPSRKLVVIGVTGTDGKTTTVSLIYHILRAAGIRVGMISTVSAVLGDHEQDTGLHVTTPTAPEVQGYLAGMVTAGLTDAVLEVTSHGLAQGRADAVDFDVAAFTNVRHEHLDFHGTWEAYRAAKGRLFVKLAVSARKPDQPKVAIVNADDPSAGFFAAIPADRVLAYGVGQARADFNAVDVVYGLEGTRFRVGEQVYHSPLLGEYNVSNALAAIAAATAVGVSGPALAEGIAALPQIPGRLERIDAGQGFLAVVDFAHTPNALEQVLTTARMLIAPGKRVICAVGSAGLRDRAKRRMMAEIAARLADTTILTAEDPRTESLESILAEMAEGCKAQGGVEGKTFWRVPDRGEALHRAIQMAGQGDIVLACGKGHEQSMCFGDVEYPWDDREALRAALRGAPLRTLPTATV